jgi:hypothetical protein
MFKGIAKHTRPSPFLKLKIGINATMKCNEVPIGYVFVFATPEGAENKVQFLRTKGQLNALNLTSWMPCKIHENAEVGIIGKFSLNRQIEPTRELEKEAQRLAGWQEEGQPKPTALPQKGSYIRKPRKIKKSESKQSC